MAFYHRPASPRPRRHGQVVEGALAMDCSPSKIGFFPIVPSLPPEPCPTALMRFSVGINPTIPEFFAISA